MDVEAGKLSIPCPVQGHIQKLGLKVDKRKLELHNERMV